MSIFKREEDIIHFIHIPKTGGGSMSGFLESNGWKVEISEKHKPQEVWKKYKKTWNYQFSIVRNPYDRVESVYFHMMRALTRPGDNLKISESRFSNFLQLVLSKILLEDFDMHADNGFWLPQSEFTDHNTDIFKLENINEITRKFKNLGYISSESIFPHWRHRARLGHSIQSPPGGNISLSKMWSNNPDVHKMFLKVYEKDFEKFEYEIRKI